MSSSPIKKKKKVSLEFIPAWSRGMWKACRTGHPKDHDIETTFLNYYSLCFSIDKEIYICYSHVYCRSQLRFPASSKLLSFLPVFLSFHPLSSCSSFRTQTNLCFQVCARRNLRDFISHIASRRVICLCMDGCDSQEGERPPTLEPLSSEYSGRGLGCWSASYTSCIPKSQQNYFTAASLWGKMTRGWRLPCFVTLARAVFVAFQGQFAVCDLWKGNVTWQQLLTSEKRLGVSERYRPFLQFIYLSSFKQTYFLGFSFGCLWGFIYVW